MYRSRRNNPNRSSFSGRTIEKERSDAVLPARGRMRVLYVFGFLIWMVLLGRLAMIQLVRGEEYSQTAVNQHQTLMDLPSERGLIFDRQEHPFALNIPVVSYYGVPEEINDTLTVLQTFRRWCDRDPDELRKRLSRPGSQFVWLARQVDTKTAAKIDTLHLAGVYKFEEKGRYYPFQQLASQIVGFTGIDNQGLGGLESKFNDVLAGKAGKGVFQRNMYGKGHVLINNPFYKTPQNGSSLVLTIDASIQEIVEEELRQAVIKTGAHHGMVLAMDPRTSDILAMASEPSFNPNDATSSPLETHRNRCVTDQIEPGSTYKIVAATAALEESLFSPTDSLYCEMGHITISDRKIRDSSPHGWLTFREIMEKSSNVGVIKIAQQLQKDRVYEYSRAYGFGALSGISLPGEAKGILRPPNQWSMFSLASVSIGQEISVTPLQLANAFCALANDGQLMEPHIIKEIRNDDGKIIYYREPRVIRHVASMRTVRTLSDILVGVVERGTGTAAKIPGIRIAGKTGTAQKSDQVKGGYKPNTYVASFAGFLPADDPQLVVLVMIDEPKGSHYGGEVAAPVFKNIVERVLRVDNSPVKMISYISLDVPDQQEIEVPDVRGLPLEKATAALINLGLVPEIQGEGEYVTQQEGRGQNVEAGTAISLSAQNDALPDLRQMPLRQAVSRLVLCGFSVRLNGEGVVRKQRRISEDTCLLIGSS